MSTSVSQPLRHLFSLALIFAATLVCEVLRPYLSPPNMVMVYLLAVVVAALRLGRWPAVTAAALGVLAFDFFFVPPRFSFSVADKEYLLTFFSLFCVGMVISELVARAGEQAESLRIKGEETATLYGLSRELSAAADLEAVLKGTVRNLEENLRQRVLIWMPDGEELEVVEASAGLQITAADREAAIWTFRSRRPSGLGTDMLAGSSMLHLPIKSPTITEGVLSLSTDPESSLKHEQRWVLEACTNQIALAVERARLTKNAEETRLLMARKNLERVLLNSISHDLRTPLVTITGVLDSILDPGNRLPEAARHELLETAREEACRLNRFVGNLLDMTRLEAGAVSLKIEPGDIQDLIGCALSAVEPRLGNRRVNVQLMPDLPLVPFDLVLMTQVVVNLLDNACKLAPESTVIDISARLSDNRLCLEVADRGPGVPESEISRIFEKFYRVPVPEGVSGTGLGLSICRGIVEAHGGMISAHNREGGGLAVAVWLPLG